MNFINQSRVRVSAYSEELFAVLLWAAVIAIGVSICGCAAIEDMVAHPQIPMEKFRVPIASYVVDHRAETAICSTVDKDGRVQMAWSCR